jgi:hypothetical protein
MRSASESTYARDVGVDAGIDPYWPPGRARLPLHLRDRLVEHLDVELEADRGDVARLLRAEQLAGATDLEVAHRDRESRAELRVVRERREAGPRLLGQLARVGIEEVRVRGRIERPTRPRIW